MTALVLLIDSVINIYIWMIIIAVIVSWLVSFGVVNTYNQFVSMLRNVLFRATEPALRPIRRYMPNLGGIDISPIVLIMLLMFLRNLLLIDILPRLT